MEPFDQDAVSDTVFMGQDMPWLAERLKFIATPEFAKMPPAEQDAAFLKARLDKTVTSGLAPIDGTAPKKSD